MPTLVRIQHPPLCSFSEWGPNPTPGARRLRRLRRRTVTGPVGLQPQGQPVSGEAISSGREVAAGRLGTHVASSLKLGLLRCVALRRRLRAAGVAQLVERQPSKLNVEGSSPFSRSVLISGFWGPNPKNAWRDVGEGNSPKNAWRDVGEGRGRPTAVNERFIPNKDPNEDFAHLAQLVERVLGKDEVTSSILVVGSKPSRSASQSHGSNLGRNSSV